MNIIEEKIKILCSYIDELMKEEPSPSVSISYEEYNAKSTTTGKNRQLYSVTLEKENEDSFEIVILQDEYVEKTDKVLIDADTGDAQLVQVVCNNSILVSVELWKPDDLQKLVDLCKLFLDELLER